MSHTRSLALTVGFVGLLCAMSVVGIAVQPTIAGARQSHPCPDDLPYPGLIWIDKTWQVPWSEHPATKIPFTPTHLVLDDYAGAFSAYYEPVEGIDTQYDGHEWTWYDPLVQYTCIPLTEGGWVFFPSPFVGPSGEAILLGDDQYCEGGGGGGGGGDETLRMPGSRDGAASMLANTCYGGPGGGNQEDCWLVWEWWFDGQGQYHERYLGSFCSDPE